MQNISERIRQILLQEYGFEVCDIHKMTTGVGGDTFLINAHQGRFIYKIVDGNEILFAEKIHQALRKNLSAFLLPYLQRKSRKGV